MEWYLCPINKTVNLSLYECCWSLIGSLSTESSQSYDPAMIFSLVYDDSLVTSSESFGVTSQNHPLLFIYTAFGGMTSCREKFKRTGEGKKLEWNKQSWVMLSSSSMCGAAGKAHYGNYLTSSDVPRIALWRRTSTHAHRITSRTVPNATH